MTRLLDWLFPIRREALCEADELMEAYGDEAYYVTRQLMQESLIARDWRKHKLYTLARRHIAKRLDIPPRLDTATRYLEGGAPELVKPKDATLH